jgi:aspartate 1-decarboxylase
MYVTICKSKIHRATITETDLSYEGSLTIDKTLMEAANMLPHERVQVLNLNNGTRLETYIIEGEPGGGTVCLNGAAARWSVPGDLVIIISYAMMEPDEARRFEPTIVKVDENNRIV